MKTLRIVLFVLCLSLTAGAIQTAYAQCAQCSATVESNNKSGAMTTKGLNNGILFLLAAPYLAVGIAGYIWYRKYRQKNVNLKKMPSQKLHLN